MDDNLVEKQQQSRRGKPVWVAGQSFHWRCQLHGGPTCSGVWSPVARVTTASLRQRVEWSSWALLWSPRQSVGQGRWERWKIELEVLEHGL